MSLRHSERYGGFQAKKTVQELMAKLSRCNPGSTVICDARSEALLVNGTRTGMYGAWIAEPLGSTVEDEDFPVRPAHTPRPIR